MPGEKADKRLLRCFLCTSIIHLCPTLSSYNLDLWVLLLTERSRTHTEVKHQCLLLSFHIITEPHIYRNATVNHTLLDGCNTQVTDYDVTALGVESQKVVPPKPGKKKFKCFSSINYANWNIWKLEQLKNPLNRNQNGKTTTAEPYKE